MRIAADSVQGTSRDFRAWPYLWLRSSLEQGLQPLRLSRLSSRPPLPNLRFGRWAGIYSESSRARCFPTRLINLSLCLGVTGFTNPPIGEALAADAGQQHVVAFGVGYTWRTAAVVAEIELGEVAMQVGFAAVLINARRAAPED